MTGLVRDKPPQPWCECMMATHHQPCGSRGGSRHQARSPAAPKTAPPSITQPRPPHAAMGCLLSPQPWEGTHPPSVGMLPRVQRMRQSLALTITWLAMSLTSRSRHGSPSPGFPTPQMLLCCKKKLPSVVGGGQGPALSSSGKGSCKAELAALVPHLTSGSVPQLSPPAPG